VVYSLPVTCQLLQRPLIGVPAGMHLAVRFLTRGGMTEYQDGVDQRSGMFVRIYEPIVDFVAGSTSPRVCDFKEFAGKSPERVIYGPVVTIPSHIIDARLHTVFSDQRPYFLGIRDCENVANFLLEGQPQNRQLQSVLFLSLLTAATYLVTRD
jgi:hypothetical protein